MKTKIKKLLVANRGEIACRVIRAAKSMGISTVAIYSEADLGSLHCELADESFCVGPASPKESYLHQQTILDVALSANVDAIHPGYGFLAENSDFARRVVSENMLWIGPSPDCIDEMGDKDSARQIAKAANVPVLPGTDRFTINDEPDLLGLTSEIGFPLLVKATAGGGGIGMKLVTDSTKLTAVVESTANLAEQAFGDGTLYLERYVANARHIEIQIFGFGNGKAIHLHERECSIQRRFQKIIEESPAPNLAADVVAKMAIAAVSLAQHQNYQGAGTVEFVLDADTQNFYFLEMNTRIQVEHPVTEMVTGRDLVKMQISQSEGTQAVIEQGEIMTSGAAIECRLYAEDPSFHFIPSPGELTEFTIGANENARIDTGYRVGDSVTIHYDPMLAKLVVWGQDRTQAITQMMDLLKQSKVKGVKNNIAFLQATLKHPQFIDGMISTHFVDEHLNDLI